MPAPPPAPNLPCPLPGDDMTISLCTAALCLCIGNSMNWGEGSGTRDWLRVLTLLLTIILDI